MTANDIDPQAAAGAADLTRRLPRDWQSELAAWRRAPIHLGATAAQVFRLSRDNADAAFLKIAIGPTAVELQQEIECLAWLNTQGAAVPRLLGYVAAGDLVAMRTTEAPGKHPTALDWPPARIVAAIAQALARLHRLMPPDACPFDGSADTRLRQARRNLDAGLVDPADFDDGNIGKTPEELYRQLAARRPGAEDLVITHGDAYLANLLIDADGMVRFIDCGRVARADRYMDLAIIAEEIAQTFGDAMLPQFCRAYGIAALDPVKLSFYKQLDEFF